jgi:hypothetical protein
MLSTQLPDYRVNARAQRASVEAPSRPSTVHRGSLKDVARPSTVHRGSHRGSRKKKFVRPLFIEVCSRLSRLALMLPSRVSRVSKKKFPKPNRRAWISSTGRRPRRARLHFCRWNCMRFMRQFLCLRLGSHRADITRYSRMHRRQSNDVLPTTSARVRTWLARLLLNHRLSPETVGQSLSDGFQVIKVCREMKNPTGWPNSAQMTVRRDPLSPVF